MGTEAAKILVIDDDEMTQAIVCKLLELDGYSTEVCCSGTQALALLGDREYGAILCDMWMAGMNGKEFYLQLKQDHSQYQNKLILITGDIASEATWEFIEERRLPYVIKPISRPLLQRRVKEILGERIASRPVSQAWDGEDRRVHRRLPVKVPARVRRKKWDVAGPDTVSAINYSRGGIYFVTDYEYRIGTQVLVACPYSGFNDVEVEGHVVRVVKMGDRFGVAIAFGEQKKPAVQDSRGNARQISTVTGVRIDPAAFARVSGPVEIDEGDALRLSEENAELKRIHDQVLEQRDGLAAKEAELSKQLAELAAAKVGATEQIHELQKEIESRNQQIEEVAEIRHRATYDALTGLLNRGAVLEALEEELLRAERDGTTVGVLLGDLDHFKRINDTYGHLAGDVVLREAARRISSAVRAYDSVGRYGGEEFLVILGGCKDTADLMSQADRICAVVGAEPVHTGEGDIIVTLSLGAASGSEYPEVEAALRAADAALYRAKRGGRNRVELAVSTSA